MLTKVRGRRTTSGFRTVRYRAANGQFYDAVVTGPGASSTEQQTVSVVGATAGNFTLSWTNPLTGEALGPSGVISFNATASQLELILFAAFGLTAGEITVTGGPANTTAFVLSFGGPRWGGMDVGLVTADYTGLTGGARTITQTRAAGSGHANLKLTSFIGPEKYVLDVPAATTMTDTGAYYLNWGPDLVQA